MRCEACGQETRCASEQGVHRCQGEVGHNGPHWADVGRSPAVLRWGMVGYGCADPECIRKPGHDMPHRNGEGRSWVPVDEDVDSASTDAPPAEMRFLASAVRTAVDLFFQAQYIGAWTVEQIADWARLASDYCTRYGHVANSDMALPVEDPPFWHYHRKVGVGGPGHQHEGGDEPHTHEDMDLTGYEWWVPRNPGDSPLTIGSRFNLMRGPYTIEYDDADTQPPEGGPGGHADPSGPSDGPETEGERPLYDELYLRLKGARERLCRAQVILGDDEPRRLLLEQAIHSIDLVGAACCRGWSRFDVPDEQVATWNAIGEEAMQNDVFWCPKCKTSHQVTSCPPSDDAVHGEDGTFTGPTPNERSRDDVTDEREPHMLTLQIAAHGEFRDALLVYVKTVNDRPPAGDGDRAFRIWQDTVDQMTYEVARHALRAGGVSSASDAGTLVGEVSGVVDCHFSEREDCICCDGRHVYGRSVVRDEAIVDLAGWLYEQIRKVPHRASVTVTVSSASNEQERS